MYKSSFLSYINETLLENSLCNLATGAAEIADAKTIVSFCRILNLWAGEQR